MEERHRQYLRVFEHLDRDGDKKISAWEVQQCMECVGVGMTMAEAEKAVAVAVAVLDGDGDGLLGFDDFVKLVEGGDEEEKVKELKMAFEMYEMEGSGCITPKSLKRMLSRLGQSTTVDQCEVMISHFDVDGNGVLTFDEFRLMMLP